MTWLLERHRGSAAAFHSREIPSPAPRAVWVFDVDRPALVVGSAQSPADVSADRLAAAGVELVRRRSGGGAVLLLPGEVLWVDLIVPRPDPLWSDDVGRAFYWVGEAWSRAIAVMGREPSVHRGPLIASRWSRQVCFAGLGPGEVLVDDRKVVGLSQRRTRHGARFQCAAYRRFDPAALVDLLAMDEADRVVAAGELNATVGAIDVPLADLEHALVAALP